MRTPPLAAPVHRGSPRSGNSPGIYAGVPRACHTTDGGTAVYDEARSRVFSLSWLEPHAFCTARPQHEGRNPPGVAALFDDVPRVGHLRKTSGDQPRAMKYNTFGVESTAPRGTGSNTVVEDDRSCDAPQCAVHAPWQRIETVLHSSRHLELKEPTIGTKTVALSNSKMPAKTRFFSSPHGSPFPSATVRTMRPVCLQWVVGYRRVGSTAHQTPGVRSDMSCPSLA